jgi:hypothetical protein
MPDAYVISKPNSQAPSNNLTKTNSFIDKKPILKKRTMSEMMLQRSLSTSSLVRQAAAAAQAQQNGERYNIARRQSDLTTDTISTRSTISREGTDYFSSQSTSGFHSPIPETSDRRHIRFDNKVEQCIAVEIKDGDWEPTPRYDSSDDEGVIMMKKAPIKRLRPEPFRRSSTTDSKIIQKLPDTTLKDRIDSPNPNQSHSLGPATMRNPQLSPSPSVETLRPKDPNRNFIIEEEEDEDDEEGEEGEDDKAPWVVNYENTEDLLSSAEEDFPTFEHPRSGGLRRTESGMFMPVDDGDDPAMGGLIGRVLDSVNTARDIAHVIWNVGWKR